MNATTTTPTVLKTPHKPPVHKSSNPNGTDNSTNLKNFFQNLLNKNAPSSSTSQTSMSSPPQPQGGQSGATPETPKLEKSPSGNNHVNLFFYLIS